MIVMKAENWIALCNAQSTMKCKKCGEILYGWKEVKEHKKKNWDHFDYESLVLNMGVCFV